MNIPNLDIYYGMADRTRLNVKDVHLVFGYKKGTNDLVAKIKRGSLPKQDGYNKRGSFNIGPKRPYWNLGNLRKLRDKLKAEKLA